MYIQKGFLKLQNETIIVINKIITCYDCKNNMHCVSLPLYSRFVDRLFWVTFHITTIVQFMMIANNLVTNA